MTKSEGQLPTFEHSSEPEYDGFYFIWFLLRFYLLERQNKTHTHTPFSNLLVCSPKCPQQPMLSQVKVRNLELQLGLPHRSKSATHGPSSIVAKTHWQEARLEAEQLQLALCHGTWVSQPAAQPTEQTQHLLCFQISKCQQRVSVAFGNT